MVNTLKPGTLLHWYQIETVLGQGGFGLTYLAFDTNLDQKVAIKEYLPTDMAVRAEDSTVAPATEEKKQLYDWGLDRFIKEARTLVQFKHHNIVRVLSVFEENNTAYMVMEYEQGQDLEHLLRANQYRSESELRNIVLPILDGLSKVHEAGFIHRDIKPGNIYIRSDGSPVLLDFGSARQSVGSKTQALTSLYTPGFAPFEQYHEAEGRQGPWTDIYALGATLYLAVTGRRPADAMQRSAAYVHQEEDPYIPVAEIAQGDYSKQFLDAIDAALSFHGAERPGDTLAWRRMFKDGAQLPDKNDQQNIKTVIHGETADTKPRKKPVSTARPDQGSKFWIMYSLAFVLMLGIAGGYWFYFAEEGVTEGLPLVTQEKPEPMAVIKQEEQGKQKVDSDAEKISRLMQLAQSDVKAGRLMSPPGQNAMERYSDVLEIQPDHKNALKYSSDIKTIIVEEIKSSIGKGDYEKSKMQLGNIARVTGMTTDLALLKHQIETGISRNLQAAEEKRRQELEKKKREEERLKAEKVKIEQQRQAALRIKQEEEKKRLAALKQQQLEDERAKEANKKQAEIVNNKIKIAFVTYGDHLGEQEQTSVNVGRIIQEESLSAFKNRVVMVEKPVHVSENFFIDSAQEQAAGNICGSTGASYLIAASYEKHSTGFSEYLYVKSYGCENKQSINKRYEIYYDDLAVEGSAGGAGFPAWAPSIRQAIKKFLLQERPLSI